jgi:zinc transporter ZupT
MERDEVHKRLHSSRRIAYSSGVAIALVPLALLVAMVVFIFSQNQQQFPGTGTALPEISIERIEFQNGGKINAFIRNTGPVDVTVVQADVNDRIQPAAIEPNKELPRLAEARLVIPFPWNEGQPYEIGVTSSDGTRFSKDVKAAAIAPTHNIQQAAFFGLIGTYVGIMPVLAGLLWLPLIKRISVRKNRFFLNLTAGLLVFLGIDALIEANGVAAESIAAVFNGQILIALVTILSFFSLLYVSAKLGNRSVKARTDTEPSEFCPDDSSHASQPKALDQPIQLVVKPLAMALMVSIGIGLHNFGEGLAIGASVVLGKIALSTFLMVGFMLHNTTEGLAIVSPLADITERKIARKLITLGLIAGAPTILGTWVGGFVYSPIAATIFLSIGAGAIFQVVLLIYREAGKMKAKGTNMIKDRMISDPSTIAGFASGMLIMYLTGLVVPS